MNLTWGDGLFLAFLTFLVSAAVLFLLGRAGPGAAGAGPPNRPMQRRNHLLFRGERLIDHDLPVRTLPDAGDRTGSDWDRVRAWLAFRFPELPPHPADLMRGRVTSFESQPGPLTTRLDLEPSGETLRMTLTDLSHPDPAIAHEGLRRCQAAQDQAAVLLHAPLATWLCNANGQPVWENAAAAAIDPGHRARILDAIARAAPDEDRIVTRLSLSDPGGSELVAYELQSRPTDQGHVVHASDITRILQAETSQNDILQALARTFASLTIGLTVFDRNKTLALFNPALINLTGLPPEFLSARPGLISFFDALRDRQVMPEPRSYGNWRAQINAMVETARSGLYQEVWSLATGQTYRVTGRPHPDGDVAFLFEDISPEVSTTRRQRTEIDLRQSVLDHLEQAIAVFSADGRLTLCNDSFATLLGMPPEQNLADMTLRDVMAAARARFPDADLWHDIEQGIANPALRMPVVERLYPSGQGGIALRLLPLGRAQCLLVLQEAAAPHLAAAALKTG